VARIFLGSYAVQFPVGGYLSWVLQWLVGLRDLGHEVWYVERSLGPGSCFDLSTGQMGDDPSFGTAALHGLLSRHGLGDRWCFVDEAGGAHGIDRDTLDQALRSADLFIDMGTHGTLEQESRQAAKRIRVDGEPGFTQFRLVQQQGAGAPLPDYDAHFTVGLNIGRPGCEVPTAGLEWHHLVFPVSTRLFPVVEPPPDAPFTTVMSWQAHEPLVHEGRVYGNKDVEFTKFIDLPRRVSTPMEIAVSGQGLPRVALDRARWRVRDAHAMTSTFDRFLKYLQASQGEFSVCKQGFVTTNSGWVGDRAGAYLASGRPVVMQDTGFSRRLPTGSGLFAVDSIDDAVMAIETILSDPSAHRSRARSIAEEYFEATAVLSRLLSVVGIAGQQHPGPGRAVAP